MKAKRPGFDPRRDGAKNEAVALTERTRKLFESLRVRLLNFGVSEFSLTFDFRSGKMKSQFKRR